MKGKRVDKLFMDNPHIKAGWLDLNICDDVIIPVSYLNSRFFYDLILIVELIDNYCMSAKELNLSIDCEGIFCNIIFNIPSDFEDDYETIKIRVEKDRVDFKEGKELKDIYLYEINREILLHNLIDFVTDNIDRYNIDFVCEDVAEPISFNYVTSVIKRLYHYRKNFKKE